MSQTRVPRIVPSFIVLGVLLVASLARAQTPRRTIDLELVGDVAYLTNGTSHGAALDAGLRLGLGRYFAVGFDVGYGVMGGAQAQDRWWIMPSVALVLPLDPLRIDLGVGIGAGAASGYADIDAFVRGPFDPDWAFQLAPAIAAHATVAWPVGTDASAFVRLDAATLLVDGNGLGVRENTEHHGSADSAWATLSLGVAVDL